MEKVLLTVDEVGQLTGLGRTLLYQKPRSGELRSINVGRCRRVSRAAIDEFVARLEHEQCFAG
jgi:excisionase family DNA binding protein